MICFSDRLELLRNEYTDHRHEKLLRHCTRLAEHAGSLSDALEDREEAEDILRWINRNYENPNTNVDYRVAFRVFGKRVTEGDEVPESISWISTSMPRSYDPSPDPADMVTKEEADRMVEATHNPRDAAAIMIAFDAGPRPGELFDLTVGDVNDLEEGWAIRVDGKTGQRTVYLNLAVPHVVRWLSQHPARDDPDAPL